MRVLVTGGSGQLGGAIRLTRPDWLFPTRSELDLAADEEKIVAFVLAARPSAVIHCGAWTRVDDAELPQNRERVTRINAGSTAAIVRACVELGIHLYFISTDYVLADAPWFGVARSEREKPAPISVYGATKWHGEREVLAYALGHVIRLGWLHGVGTSPNFIKTILAMAERGPESLTVVDDQFGRPTFADDIADILVGAAEGSIKLPSITHLQNSGVVVSWCQLARFVINHAAGLPTRVVGMSGETYRHRQLDRGRPYALRPRNSVFEPDEQSPIRIVLPDWRPRTCQLVRQLLEV